MTDWGSTVGDRIDHVGVPARLPPARAACLGRKRGGHGANLLVRVTSKARAWIWRMWLRSLRLVPVRIGQQPAPRSA